MRFCRPALASFLGRLWLTRLNPFHDNTSPVWSSPGIREKGKHSACGSKSKTRRVKFYQSNSIHLSSWRWVLMQVTGLGYRLCYGLVTCNANGIRFCYKHGTYGFPQDMPLVIKSPGGGTRPDEGFSALWRCWKGAKDPLRSWWYLRDMPKLNGEYRRPE